MSNISIYDSEYITVEYWPEKKFIYHVVHQPMSTHLETFKAALTAGTDALERYQATKWLSDDRKNDNLTEEGGQWAFGVWQPRTMQAGWKYWANVVPEDLEAAGALIPVIDQLFERGLTMRVFTTVEAATKWLDSIKE